MWLACESAYRLLEGCLKEAAQRDYHPKLRIYTKEMISWLEAHNLGFAKS